MSLPRGYPLVSSPRSRGGLADLSCLLLISFSCLRQEAPAQKPDGFQGTPRLHCKLRMLRHMPGPGLT